MLNANVEGSEPAAKQHPADDSGVKEEAHVAIEVVLAKSGIATIARMQRISKARHDEDEEHENYEGKNIVYRCNSPALNVLLHRCPQYGIGQLNGHANSGTI